MREEPSQWRAGNICLSSFFSSLPVSALGLRGNLVSSFPYGLVLFLSGTTSTAQGPASHRYLSRIAGAGAKLIKERTGLWDFQGLGNFVA